MHEFTQKPMGGENQPHNSHFANCSRVCICAHIMFKGQFDRIFSVFFPPFVDIELTPGCV